MRIMLLTDDMQPGGVPRHVTDLANGLSAAGETVLVAATEGPFVSRLRSGVRFEPIGQNPAMSSGSAVRRLPRFLAQSHRSLRAFRPDLIHSHKRFTDLVARIAGRSNRVPHVSTCHNTFGGGRWFSVFGDLTIAPTQVIAEMLMDRFGKKQIVQIPLGISPLRRFDEAEQTEVRRRFQIGTDERIIVSIGHLDANKDRPTLLRAFALVCRHPSGKRARLVIVGDGPERNALLALSEELGNQDSVTFLPATADVEALLNIAEFGAITSVRDGGVLYVVLEGATLGKPHIATRVGGIPEFTEHEVTGLLVPPGDPERFAEAIVRLFNHPDETARLGRQANERCARDHSFEKMVERTTAAYRSLVNV